MSISRMCNVLSTSLKPVLGSLCGVAHFITVNEQSESNPDCSFHSSVAFIASGRSPECIYHITRFFFHLRLNVLPALGKTSFPNSFVLNETLSYPTNIWIQTVCLVHRYILREKSLATYFRDSHFRRNSICNIMISKIYVDKRL